MLVGILSSLLTRKTLAECGLTDFRKLSPCTTILKHTSTESFHACCVPHWLGVCSYTPVVSTARLLADGRVHFVSDEPRKVQVLEQPDLFLVGSSHVGAACVKVPQEHHILHTHTHTMLEKHQRQQPESLISASSPDHLGFEKQPPAQPTVLLTWVLNFLVTSLKTSSSLSISCTVRSGRVFTATKTNFLAAAGWRRRGGAVSKLGMVPIRFRCCFYLFFRFGTEGRRAR